MTQYNIVNPASLIAGQPEDVSQVLANFQAIATILNGGIDNSNLSVSAAIAASKLANYPSDGTKFLRGDGAWSAASPQPVVNGQFIKGVGGAAVWSAIADADLPARLGAIGLQVTDLNTATNDGWHWFASGATNSPTASYGALLVSVVNTGTNLRQIVYEYVSDTVWVRRRQDATWGAWQQMWPTAKHCATYSANVQIGGGTWTAIYPTAYPPPGTYMVEYGLIYTKPEAYGGEMGIWNGGGISSAVPLQVNAGTWMHAHFKQVISITAGQLLQLYAHYDGPVGNPMSTSSRYLAWENNGPLGADAP